MGPGFYRLFAELGQPLLCSLHLGLQVGKVSFQLSDLFCLGLVATPKSAGSAAAMTALTVPAPTVAVALAAFITPAAMAIVAVTMPVCFSAAHSCPLFLFPLTRISLLPGISILAVPDAHSYTPAALQVRPDCFVVHSSRSRDRQLGPHRGRTDRRSGSLGVPGFHRVTRRESNHLKPSTREGRTSAVSTG